MLTGYKVTKHMSATQATTNKRSMARVSVTLVQSNSKCHSHYKIPYISITLLNKIAWHMLNKLVDLKLSDLWHST